MESLPSNGILQYPPNTIKNIRESYNLDKPGQMDEAIDLLDAWIKKQEHFMKKDFSRDYLERLIIFCKGSVERSKSRIDKLCTLRTIMPKFYSDYNTKQELSDIVAPYFIPMLPKYAEDYYRVIFIKAPPKTDETIMQNFYRYIVILLEYMKTHDYLKGVVLFSDLRDANTIELVKSMNISDLHHAATLCLEGYGLRLKAFHLLTSSKSVDILVSLFRQVLPTKLKNRIFVHRDLESLYTVLPRDILPKNYGGNEKSVQELHDDWLATLSSKEFVNYMKEVKTFGTDESRRRTDDFNSQYLGMAGTFRTLTVD